jgi:hypothetical protein
MDKTGDIQTNRDYLGLMGGSGLTYVCYDMLAMHISGSVLVGTPLMLLCSAVLQRTKFEAPCCVVRSTRSGVAVDSGVKPGSGGALSFACQWLPKVQRQPAANLYFSVAKGVQRRPEAARISSIGL